MSDRDRPGLDAEVAALHAKSRANLELAVILRGTISEARNRSRRSEIPTPAVHPDTSRIFAALARQEQDPTLTHYPEAAVRLAARLGARSLGFTDPAEDELRRPGAISRLFRKHLLEAGNSPSRVYAILRAWTGAAVSLGMERIRPRPRIPTDFDEVTYLLAHPDVARTVAAGGLRSGYDHWVRYGQQEGRAAHFRKRARRGRQERVQPPPGVPQDFDEDGYLFFNPDVANAVAQGRFPTGYAHWTAFGRAEGRGGGTWEPAPDRSGFLTLLEARPYGVNLYGFLSARSGLGTAGRSCARQLAAAQIPTHSIDVPPWSDAAAARRVPDFSAYRINVLQQNADDILPLARSYGTKLLQGCYNIGYFVWEMPSARPDWRHIYSYLDEIWAPSEFCRQAFQQATSLPVLRVPYSVEGLETKIAHSREYFQIPTGVFAFGCIFDVSSYMERKNPLCLIEAFRREFGDSSDVLLCLKFVNSGADHANVRAMSDAISGASNIRLFDKLMTESELVSFQNAIDCLVSPHRAEGFGLNLAEAMYLGKPVIATRYSGNLDFMRDDNSYLIDCALTPIPHDIGPYRKDNVWADPSGAHLGQLLRTVSGDSSGRQEKGRRAAREIRQNYSFEAVGRSIAGRFQELGLTEASLSPARLQSRRPSRPPSLFHRDTPAVVADEIRAWESKPVISVVTPVHNIRGDYLQRCIESVRSQYYPFWELCLCDDGSTNPETREMLERYRGIDPRIKLVRLERSHGIAVASNRAAEISTGSYLAFLDHDDEIAPDALSEAAAAIHAKSDIDFLYTDEDKIDETGAFTDHYCKPDWSPDHLLSVNYVLHLLVVRKELFYSVGQFRPEYSGAQDYDLVLRLTSRAQVIHHIPKVLYHWRKIPGSAAAEVDAKPEALDAGLRALADYVNQNFAGAFVEPGLLPGIFRVRHSILGDPLASLCILAGGGSTSILGRGTVDLLPNLVKSIAEKTAYANYEIVVVADENLSDATVRALSGIPHRRVTFPGPHRPFNFSKKVNFAWRQAHGRYVVLLNDDLEIISRHWLSAMLELLQRDGVGVVGAKLLYPDGNYQHVGMVLGVNGGAAHVYHGFPHTVGYNAFTHLVRNYSAVTAACMATRRELLETLGGFDEQLAVDYNDVDFCLRAIQRGYRVAYTPYAELFHFESSSISRTRQDPREEKFFREKWPSYLAHDPHYNPNLTRRGVDFSLDRDLQCD